MPSSKPGVRWGVGMAIAAIAVLLGAIAWPSVAHAKEFCRTSGDREICIVRIERSAKNYREYRAQVKVNGKKMPLETYDCRQQVRRRKDGTRIAFEPNGPGAIVCSVLDK